MNTTLLQRFQGRSRKLVGNHIAIRDRRHHLGPHPPQFRGNDVPGPIRLGEKDPLTGEERKLAEDHLFWFAVDQAAAHDLPVKLHTGYYAGQNGMPLSRLSHNAGSACDLCRAAPDARFVRRVTMPKIDDFRMRWNGFEIEGTEPDTDRTARQLSKSVSNRDVYLLASQDDVQRSPPIEGRLDRVWRLLQEPVRLLARVIRKLIRLDADREPLGTLEGWAQP